MLNRNPVAMQWTVLPAVGLMSVIIGLVAAIALLPADVEPAGAIQTSSLILAFGLLFPLMSAVLRSPASFFHPVSVVAVSPVYWLLLDPIQGAYDFRNVSRAEITLAFVCIGLFSSGVWLAGATRPLKVPPRVWQAATVDLTGKGLFVIACVAFVFSFSRFAIPCNFNIFTMLSAFDSGRWAVPWGRGSEGGWDAFVDHLSYFGYILPTLVVLIANREGWSSSRVWITVVLAAIIMALMSTGGGRRIIGVMCGAAACTWFLSRPKPQWRHLSVVFAMLASLLFVMQVILIYRNVGIGKMWSGDSTVSMSERTTLHVDDNFLRLAQITGIIPEHHPHTTWRWALWVAVRPVPRVFWPGKPSDFGFNMPAYLGMRGVSLSMSTVGELYLAFGYIGCFFGGMLYGRLARTLASVLEFNKTPGSLVIFSAGLLALFAGMRSAIELVLMSYVLLGWIILVSFSAEFLNVRAKKSPSGVVQR